MDHAPSLLAALVAAAGLLIGLPASAVDTPSKFLRPPQPLLCSQLAGEAGGLVGMPGIKSVASSIIPAAGNNVSYCQVNVLYGTSAEQNINVRVGLPLGPLDGGSGGVVGAWNGRTQGIGGEGAPAAST